LAGDPATLQQKQRLFELLHEQQKAIGDTPRRTTEAREIEAGVARVRAGPYIPT
jgi:hypothetical protein